MKRLLSHRPTASLVIACLALFVAMGGVGYAAATINGKDIKNRTVSGKKIKKNTLGGTVVKESSLGTVPKATSATTAGSATTADSATSASTAANAANADALGGAPAGDYVKGDARGLAVAGAVIDDSGSVTSWFNRAGGAPTVDGTGVGDYDVAFPGVNVATATHVANTTIVGVFGMATVDYSGGELHVRTYTGNLAADTFEADDRKFTVTVYASSAAG